MQISRTDLVRVIMKLQDRVTALELALGIKPEAPKVDEPPAHKLKVWDGSAWTALH